MKNEDQPHTNFWFAFAMGILAGGGLTFLLGTKKGRIFFRKLLDSTENLEEDFIPFLESLGTEIKEKVISSIPQNTNIGTVLQKIKTLSPRAPQKAEN